MNVIRGIDRIAIVLASIAMILGFFAGAQHYEQKNTGVIVGLTDEFLSFIKHQYGKEIDQDGFRSLIKMYGGKGTDSSDWVIILYCLSSSVILTSKMVFLNKDSTPKAR